MLNKFLEEKQSKALEKITSEEYKSFVVNQFLFLNSIGIANEKDLLKFHYATQYIPNVIKTIYGKCDNNQLCAKVSNDVFSKLDKIYSYNDLRNIICNSLKDVKLVKKAYPNDMGDNPPIYEYNIIKWRAALNDIHIRAKIFGSKKDAVDFITKDWGDMDEKIAFNNWLKFYDEGNHLKYKKAQISPINLPYIPGLTKEPKLELANERTQQLDEKNRDHFDKIRARLLGRLQAAKKILGSRDGRTFAGTDYEKLINTLLLLEGDVMRIKSSVILEDLIKRAEASLDFNKCSSSTKDLFLKIAQLPPMEELLSNKPEDTKAPQENKPVEPEALSLPAPAPPVPEVPKEEGKDALKEFVSEFITNEFDAIEQKRDNKLLRQDKKTAWYDINTDELKHLTRYSSYLETVIRTTRLYKTAQEVANPEPTLDTSPEVMPEAPVDAKEPSILEKKLDKKPEPFLDVKDSIDDALNDIKLTDVIKRLEALSRVFKNREIARQLSIIDLMLDKLGISGFFPALAEATRSALESNQYCQTRVEEILSKLVSATNEDGLSMFDDAVDLPGSEKGENIIDKEMKQYLTKPKKIETEEPKEAPVVKEAPVPPVEAPPVVEQTPKEVAPTL